VALGTAPEPLRHARAGRRTGSRSFGLSEISLPPLPGSPASARDLPTHPGRAPTGE
jgi:hypothetical protein